MLSLVLCMAIQIVCACVQKCMCDCFTVQVLQQPRYALV